MIGSLSLTISLQCLLSCLKTIAVSKSFSESKVNLLKTSQTTPEWRMSVSSSLVSSTAQTQWVSGPNAASCLFPALPHTSKVISHLICFFHFQLCKSYGVDPVGLRSNRYIGLVPCSPSLFRLSTPGIGSTIYFPSNKRITSASDSKVPHLHWSRTNHRRNGSF